MTDNERAFYLLLCMSGRTGLDIPMMYREMYWASEGYLWEMVQQGNVDIEKMEKDFTKLLAFWKSIYLRKE